MEAETEEALQQGRLKDAFSNFRRLKATLCTMLTVASSRRDARFTLNLTK